MKNRHLYKYFFKNALHSFLFWLVLLVVVFEFVAPFVLQLNKMMELTQQNNATLMQRMILEQLNLNLYILGFFLAPVLGIIAGRALVNRESEVLLAQAVSRRDFFLGSFIFHGLFLLGIWLIFVLLYLLVTYLFNQPFSLELIFKLVLSAFGILLPFLWVGFFSVNSKPIAVVMLYLIIFLTVPPLGTLFDRPESSTAEKVLSVGAKTISLVVPQTQTFQMIASPFSRVDKAGIGTTSFMLFAYGLLWSFFLLLSGFLVYIRKDMNDPLS
jgi:hypothetical protein